MTTDAFEKARAAGAFEDVGQRRVRVNAKGLLGRIQNLLGRRENDIATRRFQSLAIVFKRARVVVKVVRRSELQRVDENTGDDRQAAGISVLMCDLDKRQMPLVQITHGRHQNTVSAGQHLSKLGNASGDFHD